MKAVSLFAGVGGFDLALERNGVEVVATCEIDKHAQKILTRHFPKAKLFADVTTLTGEDLFNAGFDSSGIIVGGFPCQDVSVAGKRAGLTNADGTHTRSGLFWQVVRLLQETKAQYFILENVPGLLSSNSGRDFGTVIGALDELGYGIAWRILDAQYFVPQRRRRIFIVGCLGDDGGTPSEILAIAEGRAGYLEKGEQKGKATARKVGASSEVFGQSGYGDYSPGVKTLNASMVKLPEDSIVIPFTPSSFAQYEEGVGTLRSNGGDLGGGSETLLALSKPEIPTVRRLTPTECERLQGFPEIKKCATFILCLDHQKNPALAGIQNLKWQRFVGSAGNDRLNEIAWSAVNDLSSKNLQISEPAQILVRINYEAKRVEILSLGKLLWSANNAESQNLLALPIKTGDFVQASVGLMQIAEQITIGGEVELRQNAEKTLIGVTHGNYAEKQFGNEIEPPANAVNSSLTEPLSDTMFTTLPLTDLQSLEQNLQTLFCFVKPVIDGFIPTQTDQKSLLTFQIESVEGWTDGQADSHRYKQMGNAVAVPVVDFLIRRLVQIDENAKNV